ncbi:hypothetical protein DND132_0019 [Pseudodesulfovibrio mercurii]|uniref:Uncharacterized protein n=1 Tax=Pseudodesulfovibrio mercurii TaxID=641491 RepID=F0JCQ9_9BACT|nr:hypothetical protein [Pseudodesulfovibrio mercurii]EGB13237.1 hypothetical protein DND132_0019 [Pseudodesulfovibrio mercurii]
MALADYTASVDHLQKALGRAFAAEPWLLNLPGRSVACKIDQFYYLAVMPGFLETLGRLGGMFPDQVLETLVKTGNLITKSPERDPLIPLTVSWTGRAVTLTGAFVDADFIDRAVKTYGGLGTILNVSDLKISAADRPRIESLFQDKTPPQGLAYF